jgi:PKD repeat protein
MRSRYVKLFFIHLSLFGVVLVFQNCTPRFSTTTEATQAEESLPNEEDPSPIIPSENIQAQLTSNRISGVAPLAVQFDASNTTSSSVSTAFHLLRYDFNFGDDRGQTWSVSGLPKNTQSGGPIAAHVFDLPGTYTVRVTARNPANNESAQATLTITVQDPNTVFSGSNTICVSTSGNYTGCPAGSVQQTSLPSVQSQKRILLRRGESFGAISINHGISNVLIGSFGSGNKPRVNRIDIGALNPTNNQFPSDIITMDLNIQESFTQYVTGSRLLLYRCDFDVPSSTDVDSQIGLSSAFDYIVENHTLAANQYYQPREIFVVENVAFGSTTTPHTNMSGVGSQTVIMGNRMGIARQHTIRMYRMNKGFIAHNHLRGISSDGIRVALKIHSNGLGNYDDNYAISGNTWASRKLVIANNILGDPNDTNSFTGGVSPQNSGPDSREGIEDTILENNRFYRGPNTNTEFILMGRRMSNRGNVRIDGGPVNINQFGHSYELLPPEWDGPYFND